MPAMSNQNDPQTLQRIKKINGRVAVVAGAVMGVALSSYFFTFGMLIDQGATAILWFQLITMVKVKK